MATMSPGCSVWIDDSQAMHLVILCPISSVLKFCISTPLFHCRICSFCGALISSDVTSQGPIDVAKSLPFAAPSPSAVSSRWRSRAETSFSIM